MHTKQLGNNLFLVDLQTGGFQNLIASYILKGKQIIIVETGPTSSIPNLLAGLKEINVKAEEVAYVVISHVHIDNSGGAGTLLKSLPNANVIVHRSGARHLVDPQKLWSQSQLFLGNVAELFGAPESVPEDRIIAASDSLEINVGNEVKLRIVETLGHASHHLSYYSPLNEAVFPGDAAGIYLSQFDAVVPTTPPPFCLDIALASLAKLEALEPKALCYTHFGEAYNAVERLQDHAIQLKLWTSIIEDDVKKHRNLDAIGERVLAEDRRTRGIIGFLKSHPIYSKIVVENSVQGFVEAATKPPQ
jgi:glyoxylase-like metal-dependent hydrolase (beta-lactamase superfamily II)